MPDGLSRSANLKPWLPFSAVTTAKPAPRKWLEMISRAVASSSMTRTQSPLKESASSRAGGHREIKRTAVAVRQTLGGAVLTLDGHNLIDIRFLSADFRRETDGETYRALLRFRAVTEPQ